MTNGLVQYLINALAFSLLGLVVFGVGFAVFDKVTPYRLWDQIVKEKNTALAIVVAAMALGMSIIIGSAVHG